MGKLRKGFWLLLGSTFVVMGCSSVGEEISHDERISGVEEHVKVTNGDYHACVHTPDGETECWLFGDELDVGQADPPDIDFETVSSGSIFSCGLDSQGALHCWGEFLKDGGPPTEREFHQISVGDSHGCGIRPDDSVECWGNDDFGQSDPPSGKFERISAGWRHTCGLRPTGQINCWGVDRGEMLWDYDQTRPPDGTFVELRAGTFHSCAIDADGAVECWGLNDVGQTDVSEGRYKEIAIGFFHTCGLSVSGDVDCWGIDEGIMDFGQTDAPEGEFVSIDGVSHFHTCGVRPNAEVECWGRFFGSPGEINEREMSEANFESISAGPYGGCVIETGTRLGFCWGGSVGRLNVAPRGQLRELEMSHNEACAVNRSGTAICRGDDPWEYEATSQRGELRGVSLGIAHGCGIRSDERSIECWALEGAPSVGDGQTEKPTGEYRLLDAGYDYSCAIGMDERISCWEDNRYGQCEAPDGSFMDVSAGYSTSCAIETSGEMVCWGGDETSRENGLTEPPDGTFSNVEVGWGHVCAIDEERQIVCWGDNTMDRSTPPSGEFKDLAIAPLGRHSCALRLDGTIECWGVHEDGNRTVPDFFRGQTPRF